MNRDNRLKVLKPFLQDYFTKNLEEKLNLKVTKGIPNCNLGMKRICGVLKMTFGIS